MKITKLFDWLNWFIESWVYNLRERLPEEYNPTRRLKND